MDKTPATLRQALIGVLIATTAGLFGVVCGAQEKPQQLATAAPLTFDVVSIQAYKDGERSQGPYFAGLQVSKGRAYAVCTDLGSLIDFAYQLKGAKQIHGLPAWGTEYCGDIFTSNIFRIEATMPPDTTEQQASEMVRSLLLDRFKLAVHWETQEGPVYALMVRPSGFRLKPYEPKKDEAPARPGQYACPAQDRGCRQIIATGTISDLAGMLEYSLDRHVVDKTGITGTYDLYLRWAGDNSTDSPLPSLSTALRENMGLEMKPQTGMVKTLVIDHVERPTPN